MTTRSLVSFLLPFLIGNTVSQLVNCQGSTCNCPSTSGETCILDCNSTDICKGSTLNCRRNDPCQIQCSATASCSADTTINAQQATNVTIICSEEDSCKDNIIISCGTGDCQLQCNHEKACIDWGYIDVSLSSSFQCIGQCPHNIPSSFGLFPTTTPTSNPTMIPTINPTMIPTINPTMAPTVNNPTMAPFTHDHDIDATDLTRTKIILDMFNMIIIGCIIVGFCTVCIAIIWLYDRLRNKRKQSTQKLAHKHTISFPMTNKQTYVHEQKDSVLYHKSPSMDMIVNSNKTPLRASVLCRNKTKDGEMIMQSNEEMEQSSFTMETMTEQYDSFSFYVSSINQSDSGIDYHDKLDGRKYSSESATKIYQTPPNLPTIPDHKSVKHSIPQHLVVGHNIITNLSKVSLDDNCAMDEDEGNILTSNNGYWE